MIISPPELNIDFVYSTSQAGKLITKVHPDLLGYFDITLTDEINSSVDILFLCLGHSNSKAFIEKHTFTDDLLIIDMSNGFRLDKNKHINGRTFVYGLPEINKLLIQNANAIANPGCFATAIQIALLPLAKKQKLCNPIHINTTTDGRARV